MNMISELRMRLPMTSTYRKAECTKKVSTGVGYHPRGQHMNR